MHELWDRLGDLGTGFLLLGLAAFIWDAVTPEKATAEKAAPAHAPTLLTCHGEIESGSGTTLDKADIGVIINSAEHTVSIASHGTHAVNRLTSTNVLFRSEKGEEPIVVGTFDRLSGSLSFTTRYSNLPLSYESYDLRCKPAQRIY